MRVGLLIAVVGIIVGLAVTALIAAYAVGEMTTAVNASKCKDAHSQIAFAVAKKGC